LSAVFAHISCQPTLAKRRVDYFRKKNEGVSSTLSPQRKIWKVSLTNLKNSLSEEKYFQESLNFARHGDYP